MPRTRLTAKQEAFARACASLDNPLSLSDAYRAAYNAQDMSPEAIGVEASRLAANPIVALKIRDLRDEAAESAIVDDAEVLRGIKRTANSDPINLFDEAGNLLPIREMSPATRAAIASLDVEETYAKDAETGKQVVVSRLKKVRLWSKDSAQDKLAKHRGLYERDNSQRTGIFDKLPRPVVEMIEGLLREYIAGDTSISGAAPGAAEPATGGEARTIN